MKRSRRGLLAVKPLALLLAPAGVPLDRSSPPDLSGVPGPCWRPLALLAVKLLALSPWTCPAPAPAGVPGAAAGVPAAVQPRPLLASPALLLALSAAPLAAAPGGPSAAAALAAALAPSRISYRFTILNRR